MNTNNLINRFFTRHLKDVKNENEYKPALRIKSTIQPSKKVSYNEVFENVHNQLTIKE